MKIMKKAITLLMVFVFLGISLNSSEANASTLKSKEEKLKISDSLLVSEKETKEIISGNTVTKKISEYKGNIKVIEVLTVQTPNSNDNFVGIASASGSTTATKEKTIIGEGNTTIFYATLTATFQWDGSNSDCTSYSTSKYVHPNFTLSKWDTSCGWYTFLGIKTGSSYADAEYYLYLTAAPMAYHSGIINIKCSKNGGIS